MSNEEKTDIKIFVCYRRDDTLGFAHAINTFLGDKYGEDNIFIDVDSIHPGKNFVDVLNETIEASNVMLVLIGPQWNTIKDKRGRRRIDNAGDFVRLEIKAALEKNIVIIPVLVQDAKIPDLQDLPEDISPMDLRQSFTIGDRLKTDVRHLVEVIDIAVRDAESQKKSLFSLPLNPGQQFDHFQIIEQLDENKEISTYKANDTRFNRLVVVQIFRLPENRDQALYKKLLSYAKKLTGLFQNNIVNVLEYGEQYGLFYLITPFVSKRSLHEKIGKRFTYQKAAEVLLPIAKALVYTHKRGIVHGDIKPSNIILTDDDQLMLSDYGISQFKSLLNDSKSRKGNKHNDDPDTDIYALGLVYYCLVTGQNPYTADYALQREKKNKLLPNLRQYDPDIPLEVEILILKALGRQPPHQLCFQTMGEFTHALEDLTNLVEKQRAIMKDTEEMASVQHTTAPKRKRPPSPNRKPELVKSKRNGAIKLGKTQTEGKKPFDSKFLVRALGVIGLGFVIFASMKLLGGGALRTEPIATPQAQPTLTPESTSTPFQDIYLSMVSEMDGMTVVYVPEGEFLMGSEYGDESPVHTVYLDAFWIDQTEVTNAQYKMCVDSGECGQPGNQKSFTDIEYSDHPVVDVSWIDAQGYCAWAGRRLPTEAEWEKAARGTDGRAYPWGEGVDCIRANYNECTEFPDTSPVGYYGQAVASPYGTYDMAGNAWEWVADWYDSDYYQESPLENPSGPNNGFSKVLRGGSWNNFYSGIRSAARNSGDEIREDYRYGFRCSSTPTMKPSQKMATITPVPKMATVTPLVPVKSETGKYPFMTLDCNNQPITQEIIDQIEKSTELLVPDAKTVWYDSFDCDRISEYYWEVLIESPSGFANVSDSKAILYSSPETHKYQITALDTLNENISNNQGALILFNYKPDINGNVDGGFCLVHGIHPTEKFRMFTVRFHEFNVTIDAIRGRGDFDLPVFDQPLSTTEPDTDYYLLIHITNDSAFEIQLWSKEQPDEIVTTQIPAFDWNWEDLNWSAQIYTHNGTVELMEYRELVF